MLEKGNEATTAQSLFLHKNPFFSFNFKIHVTITLIYGAYNKCTGCISFCLLKLHLKAKIKKEKINKIMYKIFYRIISIQKFLRRKRNPCNCNKMHSSSPEVRFIAS